MNLARAGAVLAFVGVAAGAFGAHALRGRLAPEMLVVFETGVRYQLVHALALILAGMALSRTPRPALRVAGALFLAGTVAFSGSLYALALSGVRLWGAVTPLGGLALLAGWVAMIAGFSSRQPTPGT